MFKMQSMFNVVTAACAIIFCSACNQDLLQLEEPREVSDITVKQLTDRMSKATDPKHNYRSCRSYLMKQTLSVIGSKTKDLFTSEIHFQAPDKMRIMTYKDGKLTHVEIYNAGRGWHMDCAANSVTEVEKGIPLELMRIFTQMATPSLSATQIFKNVSVDMFHEEGDRKVYRLICDPGVDGIAPYVQYINGETYLIERMETIMYINDLEFLYVTYPADYTWYKDIRLPVTSTINLMDTTRISKMVDFKLNIDFPASDFQPPKPKAGYTPPRPVKKMIQKIKEKRAERIQKKNAAKAAANGEKKK